MSTDKQLQILRNSYSDIIFIGGLIAGNRKEAESKGTLLASAEVLQHHFIDGFLQNGIKELHLINSAFIGTYPMHCNKLILNRQQVEYSSSSVTIQDLP